jgi:hypothetical protein
VIARLPRTAADGFLDLRPLLRGESCRPPGDRGPLQAWQPGFVTGVHPSANGLLIPIQLWRHLGTAPAIHQQHNAVIPLVQPNIMGAAKGPHTCSRVTVVFVMLSMFRPSLRELSHAYTTGA